MTSQHEQSVIDQYLSAMGIVQWVPQTAKPEMEYLALGAQQEKCPQAWDDLQQQVAHCRLCALCEQRKNTVFGTGHWQAKLMVIGEAPGANEDRQGKPFVGRAGQLLTTMLAAIGLSREDIFITNVLKCRPPFNRDPTSQEVAQCTPYLQQQIDLIQPQMILSVGRVSAHYLLGVNTPLSRLRGQRLQYGPQKTPLLVTYHPAYLLRNPRDKKKAYEDLLLLSRYLNSKTKS